MTAVIKFWMPTVVALLLVFPSAAGCQLPGAKSGRADNWQRFYHPDGSFSALFPSKPEATANPVRQESVEYTEYKLQATPGPSDFRVVVTPIPKNFQFDLKILGKSAVDDFAAKGMTVLKKDFSTQNGHEVLDMLVKSGEKLNIRMRMYVDNDRCFVIIAVVPKDQSDAKMVTDFLASVRSYIDVLSHPNNAYFKEIRKVFKETWQPDIKLIQQHLDDKTLNKGDRLAAEVGVTLDKGGALKEVVLFKGSGLESFDQDAIQAVQKSAPFAHPPRALLRNNELSMKWSFILYL